MNAYSEEELKLAANIAFQISGAIANAQLYAERKRAEEALRRSEEEARRLAEEKAIMAEIGRVISSSPNIEEVYDHFVDEVRKIISCDRISIHMIDHENNRIRTEYSVGTPVTERRSEDIYPLSGTATEAVAESKKGLILSLDDERDVGSRFPGLLPLVQASLRSMIIVPLVSKGNAIGSFCASSKTPDAYADKDLRLAGDIAFQISGAIASAQLYLELKQAEEALRESERKLKTILHGSPIPVFVIGNDHKLIYWNRALEALSGIKAVDVTGTREPWKAFYSEERPCLADLLVDEEAGKVSQWYAGKYTNSKLIEGAYEVTDFFPALGEGGKWLRFTAAAIRDSMGVVVGALETLEDVTERKRTEEALQQAEEKYRSIFERVPLGIYRSEPEGRFLEINTALLKMLGHPDRETLLSIHLEDFYVDPADRNRWQTLVEHTDVLRDFQVQLRRADGKSIWVRNTSRAIRDANGKVIHYEGVLEDITEKKRSEQMLQESETRFQALLENIPSGVVIIQNGQIVYSNTEFERLRGPRPKTYRFEEFPYVHPEDVEKAQFHYQKWLAGDQQAADLDLRLLPVQKTIFEPEIRWFHLRAGSIDYQGQRALLINMMDITRTIELEQLATINDKMTSLGRVAAGIIHELRSPLSGINVYLTTLKKLYDLQEDVPTGVSEKIRSILDRLQYASNKIESVIKRVMDFSKPTITKLTMTNINESIEKAIDLSIATLRKSGIQIERRFTGDLPPCYTDFHLIEQVILNLITNAAQAMEGIPGQKKIEITTSREDNKIRIGVADSGPGIPIMLRKRIFDPFFTTKPDSSGIGLSLCRRIIMDHGGTIMIYDSEWGGAEFRIEIPIEKRRSDR